MQLLEFYNFETWQINQDIQHGRLEFYKNLYRNNRQNEMDTVPYSVAIETRDLEFITMILSDERLTADALKYFPQLAVKTNDLEVLQLVLDDPRIRVSDNNYIALGWALDRAAKVWTGPTINYDSPKLVEIILNSKDIDPIDVVKHAKILPSRLKTLAEIDPSYEDYIEVAKTGFF